MGKAVKLFYKYSSNCHKFIEEKIEEVWLCQGEDQR